MTQYALPRQWLTVEGKKMGRFGWFEKSEEGKREDVDAAQLSYFSSIFSNQQKRSYFTLLSFLPA